MQPHIIPLEEPYILYNDRKMLNFCSSDALCLSHHSELKKNAMKYILQYGVGELSSLYPEGYLDCQRHLEEKLATLLGTETCLLFATKADALHLLTASCPSYLFVESLSKTGTFSSLDISKHPHTILCVDDSYALGTLGIQGMGLAAHHTGVDLILGTFAGGCGSSGGYLACSDAMKKSLMQSSVWIPSMPSPAVLGAIDAALDLVPQMEGERRRLEQRSHYLRHQLQEIGFSLGSSGAHRIPIHLKTEEEAEELRLALFAAEILALRYGSTLVLALNILHTPDHLGELAEALMTAHFSSEEMEPAFSLARVRQSSTEAPLR